ncbi:hypothetical protein BASA61_006671 [Batrachochytrium salamandrivorans]|nr:hypothetical protein BASA61_006671 [Batrachochytrium salamandrivorans]
MVLLPRIWINLKMMPPRVQSNLRVLPPRVNSNLTKIKLRTELKRLVQVYKNDAATLHRVENKIEVAQREAVKAMHTADMIKAKLQQTGLDSEEKLELEEQYKEAKAMVKELTVECSEQYSPHVDATKPLMMRSAQTTTIGKKPETTSRVQ